MGFNSGFKGLIKDLIIWRVEIPAATYKYLVRTSHRERDETRRDKSDVKRRQNGDDA